MTNKINLSSRAFWDIDFKELDYNKHKEFIIKRVFEYGKWSDIVELTKFYGYNDTQSIIINLENLNSNGLTIASIIFNTPKQNFKCYTNKQFLPHFMTH